MRSITFLKTIDSYLGRLAVILLPKPVLPPSEIHLKRVLIIRPGGIGDATLLIPAILALKSALPEVTIDILAEKRNREVFSLCSALRMVYSYDKPGTLLSLFCGGYDAVIDTEQWHRLSAVVARLTRAPILIGFGTNDRKRLLTHPVPYSHMEYEVDSFCRLLAPLGVNAGGKIGTPYLNVPGTAQSKADKMLSCLPVKPFVVIFPGASISEKRWDADKFAELTSILHQKGVVVVTLGSRGDFAAGERITHGEFDLNLAGKTTLAEAAAIVRKGSVLVSGDSGLLHLGAGLGTPTISLFGPSNVNKWAPRGTSHIVLNKNLPCSPCSQFGYTPKCPIGGKCMAEISVEEVTRAVLKLLGEQEKVGRKA